MATRGPRAWLKRLFGLGQPSPPDDQPASPGWLAADAAGNPFGVRLLDLMQNLQWTATTRDPEVATRAVSWRPGDHRRLTLELAGTTHACDLRFPAAPQLPDGLLYRPSQMEDKWVLGWRDGHLVAARSWTGETVAVARATHDGDTLHVSELVLPDDSGLDAFGDPVAAFDWLVHAHALERRIPFPVSAEGAERLRAQPALGFSLYGRHLFCAAIDHPPGPTEARLYADGDLSRAVADDDLDAVHATLAAGTPVDAPCRLNQGATELYFALQLRPGLVEALLDAGADVNAATARGSTPLMAAVSTDPEPALLSRLKAAGADVHATDELGFTALHTAAQFGFIRAMAWLHAEGLDLHQRTEADLTALHIAAGCGQPAAVRWLLDHGADPDSPSPMGRPLQIAQAEGHPEVEALLKP